MSGQTIILHGATQIEFAKRLIDRAPRGAVVNIREAGRTLSQNAKMWAMLSDVSRANPNDLRWGTDVWKAAFMQACGHEVLWQPGLSGEPFPVGYRTSRMNKTQMAELITCIQEYGDRHGVQWSDPEYQSGV